MKFSFIVIICLKVAHLSCVNGSVFDEITRFNGQEQQNFSSGIPNLFEGDMVVTDRLNNEIKELNNTRYGYGKFEAKKNSTWPNGEIIYEFHDRFNKQGKEAVRAAINEFHKHTCVTFKQRTNENDYLQFFHGSGCYSKVGYQGGKQRISLHSVNCTFKGTALHEIMHTMGFYHEQSRADRDSYIIIYPQNIPKYYRKNFKKYRESKVEKLGEEYDIKSIMHYGNYAFSANGKMTMRSRKSRNITLGQHLELSEGDIRQINKFYDCPKNIITAPTPSTQATTASKPSITSSKPTIRVSITSPKTRTECRDNHVFCEALTDKYCNESWVKENCKQACKICIGCQDRNKNCPIFAKKYLYCNHKSYRPFMQDKCKKSCGVCK